MLAKAHRCPASAIRLQGEDGMGGREYVVICGDGEEVEIIWLKIRAWRASGSSFRYGREAEDHSHHC